MSVKSDIDNFTNFSYIVIQFKAQSVDSAASLRLLLHY